ncbi:glycosyl hydrolase family 95 catalytic domain-containing protein [Crossiella cryophila]|uniref:Alpha-L-fucosidase 2 n=1 Tax=Crossiella cryophila TaxID=43355 RepID=A0A7W7CHT1_9PSEU|nr:glycoside hydrolase N-terminal domain-containing protein [Crossiella cryophila]MBB4681493.1 alpha-L-fucosidase 2 [Crossiella cryophila]
MSDSPSRRDFLRITGAVGAGMMLSGVRPFIAQAEEVARPQGVSLVPESEATSLWYPAPAEESRIIQQGLPIGNGRLGALVGSDPADDVLYLTDATLWTGHRNDVLQDDGQFPYGPNDFGSFGLLAKVRVQVTGHTKAAVGDYRRRLDLSNGLVTASYRVKGAQYRRETYASHPDDVVVVRLTQRGGGVHSGRIRLEPTRTETVAGEAGTRTISLQARFDNGLRYAAVVTAFSDTGTVAVSGNELTFTDCRELLIVVSGGTDYLPDAAKGFRNTTVEPLTVARDRALAKAKVAGTALLNTHVADYQSLYRKMTVDLGESSRSQRNLDSWSRLAVRHTNPGQPDPELEASYLQFGRYLMITGSRDSLPINLQGLWLHNNSPDWYADYHTDINIQMNYWLTDRAGLGRCFPALAEYCLAQLPEWSRQTQRLYNDPRNRFRNSTGKIAGWTVAFSTNTNGGLGWWWHPAGNAWLCQSLWEHYEFTLDAKYLERIYPLLKGAAEFWAARLITITHTYPDGSTRQVLVDDKDWSPEHGPQDALGISYAQEIVWELFRELQLAAAKLGRDKEFAAQVKDLQERLYLPEVSPKTGMLQEWMHPDDIGERTHRHLSPLIGFFPGDHMNHDVSPKATIEGIRKLLEVRGMESFGWACAWRSACWARLRDADRAYQLLLTVMRPSIANENGTSANFFDMYRNGDRAIFQIDANFGAPTAMLEMLLYSRPGVIEFLPALPGAWAKQGRVTGIGAKGGFEVDLAWRNGKVTSAVVRSVGGTSTELRAGGWRRQVSLRVGETLTVRPT